MSIPTGSMKKRYFISNRPCLHQKKKKKTVCSCLTTEGNLINKPKVLMFPKSHQ